MLVVALMIPIGRMKLSQTKQDKAKDTPKMATNHQCAYYSVVPFHDPCMHISKLILQRQCRPFPQLKYNTYIHNWHINNHR